MAVEEGEMLKLDPVFLILKLSAPLSSKVALRAAMEKVQGRYREGWGRQKLLSGWDWFKHRDGKAQEVAGDERVSHCGCGIKKAAAIEAPMPWEEEDRREQAWGGQGTQAAFRVGLHKVLISNELVHCSLGGV